MLADIALNLLAVFAGMTILWLGSEMLVRCSAALGLRFGLSPMVVGLTIVAFATSAPELAVTLDAAINGFPDMATGNVVGSNICNLALVLGATAMILPVQTERRVWRRDIPMMLVGYLILMLMFSNRVLEPVEGLILLALLGAFVLRELHGARTTLVPEPRLELPPADSSTPDSTAVARARKLPAHPLWRDVAGVLLGVALLAAGSQLMVWGAAMLARHAGLSEAVIGLTLVALGTSLPELATSLSAALRNRAELAVGNLIGSNIFNTLGVMGTASVITPLTALSIHSVDFLVMFAVAIVVWVLAKGWARIGRAGGGMLAGGYLAYFGAALF